MSNMPIYPMYNANLHQALTQLHIAQIRADKCACTKKEERILMDCAYAFTQMAINKVEGKEIENMGKTMDILKAAMKAIGEGLAEGTEAAALEAMRHPEPKKVQEEPKTNEDEIVLTAEMLNKLYYMSADKLRIIFQGKKVRIANDPKVYDAMYYLNREKLSAIFGDGDGR